MIKRYIIMIMIKRLIKEKDILTNSYSLDFNSRVDCIMKYNDKINSLIGKL